MGNAPRSPNDERAVLRAITAGLLDLLGPRRCPGCDYGLDPGDLGFCPACAPLIEPLDPEAHGGATHTFGGPLADAIKRLKYGGRTDLAAPLGALLADACEPLAGLIDVVVPVPLHPRRLRERGFNQSSLLASPLADRLGVPLRTGALSRIRDTRVQASLDRPLRAANVRACFRAHSIRGRVLLIDDVRTTGATLSEASSALRDSGASSIVTRALAGAED